MSAYVFEPVDSLADVAPLRTARLASLTALPELFVEHHVRQSQVYTVSLDDVVGYVALLDCTLTELYLAPAQRTHADAILDAAREVLGIERAWACTFDPLALAACLARPRTYEVLGLSFRTLLPAALPTPNPLPAERVATMRDVERIRAANHPDVFDETDDIAVWVNAGWVTLFEQSEALAGFGLCTPSGDETPACDIGVRVCEPWQRRGLGAWIVQGMAARATAQGLVPTAGCDSGNAVSRRTLERAGFTADHRLLQFELTPGP